MTCDLWPAKEIYRPFTGISLTGPLLHLPYREKHMVEKWAQSFVYTFVFKSFLAFEKRPVDNKNNTGHLAL